MQLKTVIDHLSALRFMVEDLQLLSGHGRRVLLETRWMKTPEEIQAYMDHLAMYIRAQEDESFSSGRQLLEIKLGGLRDIRGAIKRLHGGEIPDDVEWFEIKSFALLIEEIRRTLPLCGLYEAAAVLPDLYPLIRLLDPEGLQIPSFYVYDAYSGELAELRRKMRHTSDEAVKETLREQAVAIEDKVRKTLSEKAQPYAETLALALRESARIDILLAKAKQSLAWNLVLPQIVQDGMETEYRGLFHPEIKQRLEKTGGEFQPVDFSFSQQPTLITGTNMGGKTVLLHMTALAQYLFQYGFGVPAQSARIAIVDRVALCIHEEEDMQRGISSFAAEIIRIDEIIALLRSGYRLLAIFDEPAQTTNPAEGAALVSGLVSLLCEKKVRAIITTHYSGIQGPCRRFRVKGFTGGEVSAPISPDTIGKYIDYSLIEEQTGEAPQEALRIATLLGIDAEWLQRSTHPINNSSNNQTTNE